MGTNDTVYVENLPPDVTEDDLCQYFGQIGVIKNDKKTRKPKIWIYKDHGTGLPKGDATVSYEDAYAAASAVQWFNLKQFKDTVISVSLAKTAESELTIPTTDPSKEHLVQETPNSHIATSQDYRGQWHKGPDGGRGRGRKIVAAPQGPQRLFGPDDWPCPSCGNTNWARRPRCNLCGAPKPGTSDMKREGQAGGFKELDQDEIVEARRRRKALEEADDGELYDDYGRIKKKYRTIVDKTTREEAALARLRGKYDPSPSGQEFASIFGIKQVESLKEKYESNSPEVKNSGKERSRSNSPKERSRHTKRKEGGSIRMRQSRDREERFRSKH